MMISLLLFILDSHFDFVSCVPGLFYSTMAKNDKSLVLSFHDSVLRDSDLDLLRGPHWLNDSLIGFYFEYLQYCIFDGKNEFLFMSPEVTQCLKGSSGAELSIFLDPLDAQDKNFIFLPLNDCEISDRPGGSHWSLLVFSKPELKFYHVDSAGSNFRQARNLVGKLAFALSPDGCDFEEQDCLKQENWYDCGIHVLFNAEMIAKHCLEKNYVENCGSLDPRIVSNGRQVILSIIKSLKQEYKAKSM